VVGEATDIMAESADGPGKYVTKEKKTEAI